LDPKAGTPGTRPPPTTGSPSITLADVARAAGVSRSTASLVLRDSSQVADATRARVRAAVEQLGYVYHRGAAHLRSSRSGTIGLLVCEIVNPFYAELTVAVDRVLDQAGYVVFLANTAESVERQLRFIRRMREQGVDGLILCPAAGTPAALLAQLRAWRMPCVQALRHLLAHDGDYVGADYELGVAQATEHLIRLGHRRIAFVGGGLAHSALLERRAGYQAALRRHRLQAGPFLRCEQTRRAGVEAVGALLDGADPPTAVLCYNDMVAFGVMVGLQRRGLQAGRDLAVIGVDDVPEAALAHPALTTVATLPLPTGEEAARLLLRRIADPDGVPERIMLPTRLVVRESCGAMVPAGAAAPRLAAARRHGRHSPAPNAAEG
jgi:LacI family transcriptional regulator